MIVGNLETIQQELTLYPNGIRKGLEYLLSNAWANLPVGGPYPIDGDKIFAKISEYTTEDATKRQVERHEKYVDIQCIVQGSEKIGIGSIERVGTITVDKLVENDIMKYSDMKDRLSVILQEGDFAICFPWDVHRANCNPEDKPVHVKKVLIKVAMDTLV